MATRSDRKNSFPTKQHDRTAVLLRNCAHERRSSRRTALAQSRASLFSLFFAANLQRTKTFRCALADCSRVAAGRDEGGRGKIDGTAITSHDD
jgi:hypothetical protein